MNPKTIGAWLTFLVMIALVAWAQGSGTNARWHQESGAAPAEPRPLDMTPVHHQADAHSPPQPWSHYPNGDLWECYCAEKLSRGPQHPTQREWYPIAKHFNHQPPCGHGDCSHGHCRHRSIPRGPLCALHTLFGIHYGHGPSSRGYESHGNGYPPSSDPGAAPFDPYDDPASTAPPVGNTPPPSAAPRRNQIPHIVRPTPMPDVQPSRPEVAPPVRPAVEPEINTEQPDTELRPGVPRNVIPNSGSSSRRHTYARPIAYQKHRLSDYIRTE